MFSLVIILVIVTLLIVILEVLELELISKIQFDTLKVSRNNSKISLVCNNKTKNNFNWYYVVWANIDFYQI